MTIKNNPPLLPDDDAKPNAEYHLEDADDFDGVVPEDALQKVNPQLAERVTSDHDPHGVVIGRKQFDSPTTKKR